MMLYTRDMLERYAEGIRGKNLKATFKSMINEIVWCPSSNNRICDGFLLDIIFFKKGVSPKIADLFAKFERDLPKYITDEDVELVKKFVG